MKTQTKPAKVPCAEGRKWHAMKTISRTRLPKDDPRGDFHVVEKCKHCGHGAEYDCIYA